MAMIHAIKTGVIPVSASTLSLKMIVLTLGLATAVSACGTKGPLEPYATAPKKAAASAEADIVSMPTLGQKKQEATPIEPPDQPFLLDFLL